MHKKGEKFLRVFLVCLAIYLFLDGGVHLLNIRLQSVVNVWPKTALSYARLLNGIYASFVFLTALLMLVAQKDLTKYKSLIKVSGFWAIFHGLLLTYLAATQNFAGSFADFPSLLLWMPFYNQYLILEALLSFTAAALIFIWIKND